MLRRWTCPEQGALVYEVTLFHEIDPASRDRAYSRSQIGNFLDELSASTFMEDFHEPGHPEGTESLTDEELMPSVVWSFPLTVELKSAEERKKEAAERAKAAAEAEKNAEGN